MHTCVVCPKEALRRVSSTVIEWVMMKEGMLMGFFQKICDL